MPAPSTDVDADLLVWAHSPVSPEELKEDDSEVPRPTAPSLRAAYRKAMESSAQRDVALVSVATLLPTLAPLRAALLAALCGALVEEGGDPQVAFEPALKTLAAVLANLAPYLAKAPYNEDVADDDADEDMSAEERADQAVLRAHWRKARSALDALSADERSRVAEQQKAADTLVPPLMAMLMRSQVNHRRYLAQSSLMQAIDSAAQNETLPMDMLFYLHRAARLSYEDEVAVVVPGTTTGALVRVHAVDSTFHALALVQRMMAADAEHWDVAPSVREALNAATREDEAQFHWLTDGAYAQGTLVNAAALAWGEAPLRTLPRRGGRVLLYAADLGLGPRRGWNGLGMPLHSEQRAHVALVRTLTPVEVHDYLDDAAP